MRPVLTVIIPTIGRPSLRRALASIASQCCTNDEVLVIGGTEDTPALVREHGFQHVPHVPGGHWGCEERTMGLQLARGRHLAFLDDDDVWLPNTRIRLGVAMAMTPDQPVLFKMRYTDGRVLWDAPVLRVGHVSTQMMLIPNVREKLGAWTQRREGDFDFLRSMQWHAEEIVWRQEVIAEVAP